MDTLADLEKESVPAGLDNLSIILVNTRYPGNIGSTARAMKNMGLSRLVLVNPQTPIDEEAYRLAGKAADILDRAEIHDRFENAAAAMNLLAAATSGRGRNLSQPCLTPREAAAQIRPHLEFSKAALVFGTERSGLTDDLLARCQYLISVPSAEPYPVLNLAQAVLLCGYEFFLLQGRASVVTSASVTQREREELYAQIESVLIRIGFLSSSNPAPVMKTIRAFWGGPEMTPRYLSILRGIMSHIDWYVEKGYELGPEGVRKP